MDISWYGQACFRLRGKSTTIVCDPFDPQFVGLKLAKLSADIVTVSHDHKDHNHTELVSSTSEQTKPFVITGPGEYGVEGASIVGIATFHDHKSGAERGRNTIYQIELDGLVMLHCGDLGHILDDQQLNQLSDIDILMIPVGGVYTITGAQAAEIVAELEPSIVIPMHYKVEGLKFELDAIDKFLKEMGTENITPVPKLAITKEKLPEEPQVIILEKQ